MINKDQGRRSFLKLGATSVGSLLIAAPVSKAVAGACGITPVQTSGPFYPGEQKFHPDNDLTQVTGRTGKALGQVIYVRGKAVNTACAPVRGATVEIWQACASGKYNHPDDPNTAEMDPNFKYWGEATTDQNGQYLFKSIVPGAYPADTNWMRPPHVHFKVSKLGFHELTTQMYFKGNKFNKQDLILNKISPSERTSVLVDFQPSPTEFEADALVGHFDITLSPVR